MLLDGISNIGIIYFRKELEFHKQFLYRASGSLANFVVAITAALILKNVWALVLGLIADNVVRFIVSYTIHSYRPRFSCNAEKLRELFGFGKWIFGASILFFLITQGDDIFVGKLLGVTALGFYQLAYRISNMPVIEIAYVMAQVMFPAYSKIQDELPRLREAFLKTLQLTSFLSFPTAGLIFVLAQDFTKIFLGEKWMLMVPTMQMLCMYGLTKSFGATAEPLFRGVGKPKIITKLSFLQLIILILIIYPLTKGLGILGTAISVVIPNFIAQVIASQYVFKIIQCDVFRFLRLLLFPLIASVVMILVMLFLIQLWGNINMIAFFAISVIGLTCYLAQIYLFKRLVNYDVIGIMLEMFSKSMKSKRHL
jgi:O-antigen/teichoic acid export membrane protein